MTRQTWVLLMNPRRSNLSGLSVSKFPGRTVGASFFDPSKQRLEKLVGCERRAVADDDHFSFCPRRAATFIRLASDRKPISPIAFERTNEITTASFSRP